MSGVLRLRVVTPGLATTVQDRGRLGYEHLGVMVNGALDERAAAWANRLAGNDDGAAVLEMTLLGPTLKVESVAAGGNGRAQGASASAALAGADLSCTLNGERWPPGERREVRAGDRIACGPARRGVRAYLAIAGGIDVPEVLGSRATDVLAGIGGLNGRVLRAGDVLPVGARAGDGRAGRYALFEAPETLMEREVVRVLPGHRAAGAARRGLTRLVDTWYRVDPRSDRVGLRLVGPKVPAAVRGDEISEGMAIGAVEITNTGEPLLLLRSRGSIGGYPTLAVVISADIPALAQRKPGDRLRFALVDESEALRAWREQRTVTLRAPEWAVVARETLAGEPRIAEPGERVERGSVLAMLEVMGSRRPLLCPVAGRLERVLVVEGAAVRAGNAVCEVLAGA
ncbi:MAG TPA: 5-oxoprolinase/urea amidolyase family protein [Candidatus Dormibacteraeota bacterium]|nr:5-oxoprolinase/urea amidolyase family protein [Candidatus Dormibacteraeota bacterium]